MSGANSPGDDPSRRELEVREAILAYVKAHPHAADAIEGIATWWLRGFADHVSRTVLEAQLDKLVQAGELRRIETPDGGFFYTGDASRVVGKHG